MKLLIYKNGLFHLCRKVGGYRSFYSKSGKCEACPVTVPTVLLQGLGYDAGTEFFWPEGATWMPVNEIEAIHTDEKFPVSLL